MKGFAYLKNVASLQLDQAACIGCGRCAEVCPHLVFAIDAQKARIADLDACMECGACARNCPVGAILVASGVGCASGLINEWLGERNLRGFSGGCCD